MGFHHVALATNDSAATHAFYTEVMGFNLVKVVSGPTPGDQGGWSKHFFYSTGESSDNGMIAFWELHDPIIGDDYGTNINSAVGLPAWVNHIAFDAPTRNDLERHRDRWRQHGHHVVEVDHEFCISIYILDPSGNMVEFCHSVRDFTDDERTQAVQLLTNAQPPFDAAANVTVHPPLVPATA